MSGVMEAKTLGLLAKLESSYGVDASPVVATDGIMVKSFTWDFDLSEIEKQRMGARPRAAGIQPGKYKVKWKCEVELQGPAAPGGGDPYIAPAFLRFLKACGIVVTTSGTPVNTHTAVYDSRVAQPSLTIYHWFIEEGTKNALQTSILGARATVTWQVGINEAFVFTFEGEGKFGAQTDLTTFTEPTYQDIVEADDAANGKAMTVTIGGVSTDCTNIKFKSNRTLSNVDSVQQATGLKMVMIDVKPGANFELEMDRELELKATRDDLTEFLGQVKVAWSITIDTAGGNRLVVSGSALQRGSFKWSAKDGHWRVDSKLIPCDSSSVGDNAVSFAFSRTP